MTNTPDLTFDPDGLLPDQEKVAEFGDALGKTNSLVITELTDDQFKVISDGVLRAMSADPRNRVGQICGKLAFFAFTMVFVAACVWVVAFIVANLPTR